MKKLRVLDLFSGIGGFSLGLERTGGFETVAFCEIDPFCREVLTKHWPNVPIHHDVRTLDYDGPVDVISGGYPCQPFSAAGKRQGEDDDRHLWPAMFSLIKTYRPSWVLCENVDGHISMGLDSVLSDLESKAYTCQSFVLPACAVNAKHRRNRIWIIANNDQCGCERTCANSRKSDRRANRRDNISRVCEDVADASIGDERNICQQRQGQGPAGGIGGENGRHYQWPIEPNVGRVAHGVPRRVDRLRSLGNAVVPQIPELIGHAILAAERDAA